MPSNTNGDKPHTSVRGLEDLPLEVRRQLQMLAGDDKIEAIVDSDLLFIGRYGHNRLVLCAQKILVVEDGVILRNVRLCDIASAHCKDFVGNGVLELRLKDGQRLELIRYSKTMSERFGEIADRVNKSLAVSEEELEAREDEISKVSRPKEDKSTYRCPNCGHPLANASDVCPKCTSKRQVMMRLMSLMRGHWRLAIVGLVLSIVLTAVNLAPGLLVRELVDKALRPVGANGQEAAAVASVSQQQDPSRPLMDQQEFRSRQQYLYVLVGIFMALVLARTVLAHFRIRIMGALGEKLVVELRSKLYRTLQRLSLSYYDREHTGRIMARVLTDTRVVQGFVVQAVQQMIIDILTVIGIAAVLFSINWRLAAIALFPIPIVVLIMRYFSKRFQGVFRSVRRKYATLSASVSETISGMRVVKSFAQEEREIEGFNAKNVDCYNAHIIAVHARARFGPTVGLIMSLGVLAVWLIGGRQVLESSAGMLAGERILTLGTLLLFVTYMNNFYAPVQQLMNLTEVFQQSATAAERIFNVMDTPVEVGDHDGATELENVSGRVDIRNVSFAYNQGERILKNINIDIKPGEMIGLVGQTGSGKSTLVSLVCRFYDPTKGQIFLDETNLTDIKTKSLRSRIGMVLQDSFLFAGTIRENIAYSRPGATEREIIRAAQAANAHDFIMNLPDGYDSEVGERGVMLSGGEKQRISIARAILKDPAVLILDEATSAVDTATEAMIQDAMDRLVRGRTTIAIAHRLSTLRNADRLIVLDQGEIIEQGTHDDLMRRDGVYAKLCKIQAKFATAIAD